jgi:hypothetical protein
MPIIGPRVNLDRAMRRSGGVLVFVAGLAGGDGHADSNCISSQLRCDQPIISSAPSYSVCCPGTYEVACASYDIPAGALSGSVSGSGERDRYTSVAMSDSFQVVGPADGTPLEFTAQLILSGSASGRGCGIPCCDGYADARLLEGSSNSADSLFYSFCGTQFFNTTLEVQVRRLSGERFQVTTSISAAGSEGGSGAIDGTLRFSGLPEGASVVSCNGFSNGPPVPVTRGSWGRLKTHYR